MLFEFVRDSEYYIRSACSVTVGTATRPNLSMDLAIGGP